MTLEVFIGVAVIAIITFLGGWYANTYFGKNSLSNSKIKADEILKNAEIESETLKKEKVLEANDEFYNLKQKLEDEFRNKRQSLQGLEQSLKRYQY